VPYQPEALTSGRKSGLLGGLHVGYNWQFAPQWLVGVEGDFTWTNTLDQSSTAPLFGNTANPATQPPTAPIPGSLLNFDNQTRWLSSIRGRAGIILASNLLVYGTGGVAWTRYNKTAVASCLLLSAGGCGAPAGAISSFSQEETKAGEVLGAGAEWQIPTTQWRARIEYLYYGFDNGTIGSGLWIRVLGGSPHPCIVTPTCSSPYTFSNQNFQTVRLGISYAFGFAAAPAVCK
jgi:outer membrane immunogenic protein